jgi:beta-phosphoglucomutase-like phosphatase (HAD superfamily)
MAFCRAVLLDVDGTLVDSNDAHARAWVKAIASAGYPVTFERVRSLVGMGGDRLLPELTGLSTDSEEGRAIVRSRAEAFAQFLPTLKATPGAVFLLSRLKALKVQLVVVTSAARDEVTELLDMCDMCAR